MKWPLLSKRVALCVTVRVAVRVAVHVAVHVAVYVALYVAVRRREVAESGHFFQETRIICVHVSYVEIVHFVRTHQIYTYYTYT